MKYILGVIALFLVTILAVVLVTRQRGGTPEQQQESTPRVTLEQQAKPGTSAVFTTQGKLVGQTERRGIRVTVTSDERRLEILTGYEEAVERAHVFANTDAAYETFLVALDQAGFTRRRQNATNTDERGVCPLGKRYIYEFKEFSQQKVHLWSSSCAPSKDGTFGGISGTVRKLFEEQIPDYNKLVRDVDL